MKHSIILGTLLAASPVIADQTPNQILAAGAPFQALSQQQLGVVNAILLCQIAFGSVLSPGQVLSSGAAFQALSDRDLAICQVQLLNQVNATFPAQSSLQSILGTNSISAAAYFTNRTTTDGQRWLTNTAVLIAGQAAFNFHNSSINDATFTNAAAFVGSVATIGATVAGGTNLDFRNLKVYGQHYAMLLSSAVGAAPNYQANIYDSWFQSTCVAAETRWGNANFYSCTFVVTNTAQAFTCAFTANDAGTNRFYDSEFNSDDATATDYGFIVFDGSHSTLLNCIMQRRKNPSLATASLVSILEGNSTFVAANTVFRPRGALVMDAESPDAPAEIRLENCVIDPATNGIVIVNNWPVTVHGGNLVPANFSTPSKVVWIGEYPGLAGSGANAAGGDTVILGGNSTGTGRAGAVRLQTAPSGGAGSTLNTLVDRTYISAKEVTLTESAATLVFNASLASGKSASFRIFASTRADDATDFQMVSEEFVVAAISKAGTVTTTVSAAAPQATRQSSGTLTTAWTAIANGAGIDFKNSAASSLTQTTLVTRWRVDIDSNDTGITITPQ